MMDVNTQCNHDSNHSPSTSQQIEESDQEDALVKLPVSSSASALSPDTPNSFSPVSIKQSEMQGAAPLRPSGQSPIIWQSRSNLQSPMSLIMPSQPPSLFLQALSKLNESSLNMIGYQLKTEMLKNGNQNTVCQEDITTPDSLTSAPPSYSFVLRQIAARRRPRLMGTFFPSPSFVRHTPPPTYATAFDIYVDNPIPPPPQRVYHFGFASMPAACPECGFTGMTLVISKITLCTHMCAFLLCLLCCWLCAPLPYILRSCKDVYHYCQNCRTFLGIYCPTNPEGSYS